jgi:hypothetical protein
MPLPHRSQPFGGAKLLDMTSVTGHLFIIRVNVQKRWRARNNVSRNVQKRTTTGAAVQEITRHWCWWTTSSKTTSPPNARRSSRRWRYPCRKDRRRYLEPTARQMIFSPSAMKSVARLPEVIDAALRSSCRGRYQRGQFSRVDQHRRNGLVSRWTLILAPTVIIFFDLLVYAPLFRHLSEH